MVIYKAINTINGKIYIGQTVQKLKERIGDHKRKAYKYGSKTHFHSAIRKYGFDNFVWETIDKAIDRETLSEKEIYWIDFFNSTDRDIGYNLTYGGESCCFTPEVKLKIGLLQKGRKMPQTQVEAMRERMKGENNHFYGKHHTEETKRKISESRKGKGLGQTQTQKEKCPKKGSSNGMAKINENKARYVKLYLLGGFPAKEITGFTGASIHTIYNIKNSKTWRHITI